MDEKEAKKKRTQFMNFVKNTLRRASYRWPPRDEAIRLARVARGFYKCSHCEVDTFKRQDVELDHIEPVIPIKGGFTTWDEYITRLFPQANGYQVLCKTCHGAKTMIEDTLRAEYNAIAKKEEKEQKKLAKSTKKV